RPLYDFSYTFAILFLFLLLLPPPRSTLFPYTTLFRSLTLERRLLRDRGIDLDFTTAVEATYLKGDPNALFDLLVNLVRNAADPTDRKSTRLNSSHVSISYAVFCLKKKINKVIAERLLN